MRRFLLAIAGMTALILISALTIPVSAIAQGNQQAAGACVSPLPPPPFGAFGGRGGRGFGRGGPPPDGAARPDSTAPHGRGGRGGRGMRPAGCPPFFPDSLALSPTQSQQIVALRATFRQQNAPAFTQLRAISDSARAAMNAGATRDQMRAIMEQAKPINESLRAGSQQVQSQVEALLTPGQLAWMKAFHPPHRR